MKVAISRRATKHIQASNRCCLMSAIMSDPATTASKSKRKKTVIERSYTSVAAVRERHSKTRVRDLANSQDEAAVVNMIKHWINSPTAVVEAKPRGGVFHQDIQQFKQPHAAERRQGKRVVYWTGELRQNPTSELIQAYWQVEKVVADKALARARHQRHNKKRTVAQAAQGETAVGDQGLLSLSARGHGNEQLTSPETNLLVDMAVSASTAGSPWTISDMIQAMYDVLLARKEALEANVESGYGDIATLNAGEKAFLLAHEQDGACEHGKAAAERILALADDRIKLRSEDTMDDSRMIASQPHVAHAWFTLLRDQLAVLYTKNFGGTLANASDQLGTEAGMEAIGSFVLNCDEVGFQAETTKGHTKRRIGVVGRDRSGSIRTKASYTVHACKTVILHKASSDLKPLGEKSEHNNIGHHCP